MNQVRIAVLLASLLLCACTGGKGPGRSPAVTGACITECGDVEGPTRNQCVQDCSDPDAGDQPASESQEEIDAVNSGCLR